MDTFRAIAGLGLAFTLLAGPAAAESQKPLTKAEVDDLVSTKADSASVATALDERGIDFEPTDDYLDSLESKGVKPEVLNSLQAAAPSPLTMNLMVRLLKSGSADKTMAAAVLRRGLSARPTDDDLDQLRFAGAGDLLVAAMQKTRETMPVSRPAASTPDAKSPGPAAETTAYQIYGPGPDITPPEAMYQPDPPDPPEARKSKTEGIATLGVVVNALGNIAGVAVVNGLGHGLDESALATVKTWRFKPALRNGVPVAVRVNVEVEFRLRD